MQAKLLSVLRCAPCRWRTLDANAQTLTKMTIATGVDPAFSQFYVAKEAGLFEKNGLDVTINTGPSGSAMVPFLINNQVQAAYGSDLAGVINHKVDNNVVAVADGTYLRQVAVGGRPQRRDARRAQGQEDRHRQGHRQRDLLDAACWRSGTSSWPTTSIVECRGARDAGRHRARRHRRLRGLGAVADAHAAWRSRAPRSCRPPRASTTTSTSST